MEFQDTNLSTAVTTFLAIFQHVAGVCDAIASSRHVGTEQSSVSAACRGGTARFITVHLQHLGHLRLYQIIQI